MLEISAQEAIKQLVVGIQLWQAGQLDDPHVLLDFYGELAKLCPDSVTIHELKSAIERLIECESESAAQQAALGIKSLLVQLLHPNIDAYSGPVNSGPSDSSGRESNSPSHSRRNSRRSTTANQDFAYESTRLANDYNYPPDSNERKLDRIMQELLVIKSHLLPSGNIATREMNLPSAPVSTTLKYNQLNDLLSIHQDLSRDMVIMRQIYQQQRAQFSKQITDFRSQLAQIRQALLWKPTLQSSPVDRDRRSLLENSTHQLTLRLSELESGIGAAVVETDRLKQDIIRRKRYPTQNQISDFDSQFQRLGNRLAELQRFRSQTIKSLCKQVWELELERVVGEQTGMKQLDSRLAQIQNEWDVVNNKLQAIQPICKLNPIDGGVVGAPVKIITNPTNASGGMASVLDELKVTVSSASSHAEDSGRTERISAAVQQMERVMEKRRKEETLRDRPPLLKDIENFNYNQLAPTGGVEGADRLIQSRSRQLLLRTVGMKPA